MKVEELEGEALNLWVAKAAGIKYWIERSSIDWEVCADTGDSRSDHYSPSTDWSEGGPIIERERINIQFHGSMGPWRAYGSNEEDRDEFGETPLIAAMRAFVASKFGEEVPESAN